MLIVLSEYIISLCLLVFAYLSNSDAMMCAFLAISIAFILFPKKEESMLFMLMIANVAEVVTLSYKYHTSVFAFLLVAYIAKHAWKFKINKSVLVLYLIFAMYMILGLRYGQRSLLSDIQTILNYLVLLLFVAEFDNQRILNYLDCFITGHFIATIFSFCIVNSNRYAMVASLATERNITSSVIIRFSGMHIDPNFFALHCAFSIACLIFILSNNIVVNKKKYSLQLVGNILLGLLSLSKTFIIVIVAIILVIICTNDNMSLTKKIFFVFTLLSVYVIFNRLSNGMLYTYTFDRFNKLNAYHGSTINALSTGRVRIWEAYLRDWISDFRKTLFGVGMARKQLNFERMHHNTYIEILYQFGIIGSLIFLMYITSIIKVLRNKNSYIRHPLRACLASRNKRLFINVHEKPSNLKLLLTTTKISSNFQEDTEQALRYRYSNLGIMIILLNGFSLGIFAFNTTAYILFLSFVMSLHSSVR